MLQALNRFTLTITMGAVFSASTHAIMLAVLVFGLPELKLEPEEPETIEVELVLPQEEAPPLEVPEEQPPPVPQPRQVPEQQQQALSAPEPEPEVEPESAAEETPEAEAIAEPEDLASADPANARPLPPRIFQPVYQFGEEDSGPSQSDDGDAKIKPEETNAPTPDERTDKADAPGQPESVIEATNPDSIIAPQTDDALPKPAEPSETVRSANNDGRAVATTAIGEIPRSIRAGRLCATELRSQMTGSLPPYWPDILPTYPLKEGTILQIRKGAFRSEAQWYNLSFRCEVDEDATRVVSFEFEVGAPIPRAEWAARGFPAS